MKVNHNEFLIKANDAKKSATCVRLQVGAVIVKRNRILSSGSNGTPEGIDSCEIQHKDHTMTDEEFYNYHHEFSTKYEVHAEVNAIGNAVKNHIDVRGSAIYITCSPCIHCAKLIVTSGITEVYYSSLYDRDQAFVELFNAVGITHKLIEVK